MKAKVKATGEIVEVYHESQHGQTEIIYKEAVFVNGRIWTENELEFLQDKSPRKVKIGGTLKSMLDNMDEEKLAKTRKKMENSVSKDLETELGKYVKDHFTIDKEQLDRFGLTEKDYVYSMDKSDMLSMICHFSNWQKHHMEVNRLEHCNSITNEQAELEQKFLDEHLDKHDRMPTFLDAIEYGMGLQKEQMMKDAITIPFSTSLPNEIYNPLWINGAEIGDKIKLIIIKED